MYTMGCTGPLSMLLQRVWLKAKETEISAALWVHKAWKRH